MTEEVLRESAEDVGGGVPRLKGERLIGLGEGGFGEGLGGGGGSGGACAGEELGALEEVAVGLECDAAGGAELGEGFFREVVEGDEESNGEE